jgi:hypothetical protein
MTRVIVAILFVWAGVLLGVSFIATPAKFLAPSLPMAQALDVGRWTFHVLSLVEWGFAAASATLLVAAWRTGKVHGSIVALIAVVVLVMAAETFALRPLLDARVLQIMKGEIVSPTPLHKAYIALEGLRFILILAAGMGILRYLGHGRIALRNVNSLVQISES